MWRSSKSKYLFHVFGWLQLIYILILAVVSWQAAELYGTDNVMARGMGRGYMIIYGMYVFSLAIFLLKNVKVGFIASVCCAVLLYVWAVKYAKIGHMAAVDMQYFLVPVTATLLVIYLKYKNA